MTLNPITTDMIRDLTQKGHNYYCPNRLKLYERVVELSGTPKSVLEIGSYLTPLFPEGDTLDIRDYSAKGGNTPTFVHDGGDIPWPIDTYSYDLVIGLQVWEHFGKINGTDNLAGWFDQIQALAFRELYRIAKGGKAILSFPFHLAASNTRHALCNEATIQRWTCHHPPIHSEVIGPRIIKVYEF